MPFSVFGLLQYNVAKIRLRKQKKAGDRTLLILTFLLTILGLIAVADASAPLALNTFGDKFYFVKSQAIWGMVGIVLFFIASRIHFSFWEKLATPLFWLSVTALVLVLVPGLGVKVLGARRWFIVGPISIQPSEIVKLTIAFYMAKLAMGQKGALSYFIPLGLVGALMMLQPDLGTTLVILVIAFAQIFTSGMGIFPFLGAGAVGAVSAFLLIITSDYRRERLMTFIKATQDPLGRDYHIRQVLLALGSGGLFGIGLGQSRQKFLFLPEAATDSIFAIIAEETGFIGAIALIFLFGLFIYKVFVIAGRTENKFAKVLAVGIAAWIGGQAFLNIGSMVALTPLTGIPLPFFSYGGSSLTMVLFACGILLNIAKEA